MGAIIAATAAWLSEIGSTVVVGTTTVADIATSLAVSVAITEVSTLLQSGPKAPAAQKQTLRQAVGPRVRAYGQVKVGGTLAFLDDRSSYLYQLIMLNSGEIDSFVSHWLADEQVTLSGSNVISPTNYYDGTHYFVTIDTVLGTSTQAAFSRLTSAFPGEWTSAHQLKGIACSLVTLLSPKAQYFTQVFPSGLPNYNAVIRASKVWDPRDVAQDPDDPSTWTWTDNGVLIVLDYLWHDDGMRLPRSMIEAAIDVWKDQANIADEAVDLKAGGTEPRYRLSGQYQLTDPPKSVLPKMLVPMDARLFLRGDGAICIDVGKFVSPTVTLFDGPGGNIVDYSGLTRARDIADLRNEITAQFVSADYDYVEQDADPWQDTASIDVDGLQTMALDLTWVPSHAQARRRMKIEAYRQNPAWSGTIVTNAYGLRAMDQRFVTVQISELGLDDVFEVQKWSFDPQSGNCTMQIALMPAEAYAWEAETEEGTAPNATATTESDVEVPDGLDSDVTDGVITATWDAPDQPSLDAHAQWRTHDSGVTDADATWTDMTITGNSAVSGTLSADDYDVRVRFTDPLGFPGAYTYLRSITVP